MTPNTEFPGLKVPSKAQIALDLAYIKDLFKEGKNPVSEEMIQVPFESGFNVYIYFKGSWVFIGFTKESFENDD